MSKKLHYDEYWLGEDTEPAQMAAPPPTAVVKLPPDDTLPKLMALLVERMHKGEKFTLTIVRKTEWDAPWKNRMYLAMLPLLNDAQGDGILRWIGRGLDQNGAPFRTKNGGSYIRMAPDKRQVGMAPAVEIEVNGETKYRQIGFFLLFNRASHYIGETYTGVPEYPLLKFSGELVQDGTPRIECSLSLVAAGSNGLPAAPEPPPKLKVVVTEASAPKARYNW